MTCWLPVIRPVRSLPNVKRLSQNPACAAGGAGPSGARTQGGSNSSAIAPTEDAASAQVRRRQACAGGFQTASIGDPVIGARARRQLELGEQHTQHRLNTGLPFEREPP